MRTGGSQIGQRTGRPAEYDPSSGRSWRPGGTFAPDTALKLYRAMEALDVSASGVLNELVRRMEVDDNGRPLWADEVPQARQLQMVDVPAA